MTTQVACHIRKWTPMCMDALKSLRFGIMPFSLDPLNPASRLRGYHLQTLLRRNGYSAYLVDAAGALNCDIVLIGSYDLLSMPIVRRLNALLQERGKTALFDFADDVLADSPDHLDRVFPQAKEDFFGMLGSVNMGTVSSLSLKNKYAASTSRPIEQLDDIVDAIMSPPSGKSKRPPSPVKIGWMGYSSNVPTLLSLQAPLSSVIGKARKPVEMLVMTSKLHHLPFNKTRENLPLLAQLPFKCAFREWSLETSVDDIAEMDIGLVPVKPGCAKSSNRIVSLALSGVLPIASDTIDNRAALGEVAPELLCKSQDDWESILDRAVNDAPWREARATEIRRHMEERYSPASILQRWLSAFDSAFEARGSFQPLPYSGGKGRKRLDISMLEALVRARWENLRRSHPTACLYGAGKHTKWLLEVLSGSIGPEIIAILDDNPPEERIGGIPVIPTDRANELTPSCIILSSDTFQDKMTASLKKHGVDRCPLLDLYWGLPLGPYAKEEFN